MTFEEVLPLLKQGKRIRRACWQKELYLKKYRVSNYSGEEYDDIDEKWGDDDHYAPFDASWFCTSDLLEEDWEVVE